jgi:hypothetical protein
VSYFFVSNHRIDLVCCWLFFLLCFKGSVKKKTTSLLSVLSLLTVSLPRPSWLALRPIVVGRIAKSEYTVFFYFFQTARLRRLSHPPSSLAPSPPLS